MMRRKLLLLIVVFNSIMLAACSSGQLAKYDRNELNWNKNKNQKTEGFDLQTDPDSDDTPKAEAVHETGTNLYFFDETSSQLFPETVIMSNEYSSRELILQVIKKLIDGPNSKELAPVLPKDIKINRVEITDNIIVVDLSSEFYQSENLPLARATLVNTLLGLGNAKYVKLLIDGQEAAISQDDKSVTVGLLTRYPAKPDEIEALEAKTFGNTKAPNVNRELFFQDHSGQYLLPEVRNIIVKNGDYVKAVVNELIKGPAKEDMGFYPTLPKGTALLKTEVVEEGNKTGVSLYFSKEYKTQFTGDGKQEAMMVSSIIYSMSTVSDIDFVNIYYDKGNGEFVSRPIAEKISYRGLTTSYFPNKLGKRIRVYFGDEQGMLLVSEYRAISRNEKNMLTSILAELATDPVHSGSVRVLPPDTSIEDIRVHTYENTAIVDIPSYCLNNAGMDNKSILQALYAVSNTLTDPINSCGINEVKFTVDGELVDYYADISLQEPFVMNSALIKEEP